MNIPFTTEQFFEVFKNYNQAVFPVQFFLLFTGVTAVILTIKHTPLSDKLINIMLAFLWLWMGIVYQFIFFTVINKAAYLFGTFFILQGILFLIYGVFSEKLSYRLRLDIYGVVSVIILFYSFIIYPLLGYVFGHAYLYLPTFGLPCPTTIFTFSILLISLNKCPFVIMVIPAVWAIIGFSAALNFGIYEDTGLIIAGFLTIIMLSVHNYKLKKQKT